MSILTPAFMCFITIRHIIYFTAKKKHFEVCSTSLSKNIYCLGILQLSLWYHIAGAHVGAHLKCYVSTHCSTETEKAVSKTLSQTLCPAVSSWCGGETCSEAWYGCCAASRFLCLQPQVRSSSAAALCVAAPEAHYPEILIKHLFFRTINVHMN